MISLIYSILPIKLWPTFVPSVTRAPLAIYTLSKLTNPPSYSSALLTLFRLNIVQDVGRCYRSRLSQAAILLLVDRSELRGRLPGGESVHLLEAHDHRPPTVRVDAVAVTGQAQLVQDMGPDDLDFDGQEGSRSVRVLLHQLGGAHDLCLHLHRTLGDAWRSDEIGRLPCQPGSCELVFAVLVAEDLLQCRDDGGARCSGNGVDVGPHIVAREIEDTLFGVQEIDRGL